MQVDDTLKTRLLESTTRLTSAHLRFAMQMTPKKRRPQWTQGIESLEDRALLSGISIGMPPIGDAADTADQATVLNLATTIEVSGSIGQDGLDVDWYTFTLLAPSSVTITGTAGTYGLYNNASGTEFDPLAVVGRRLLAQSTATETDAGSVTRDLAPGMYFVAVSGAGNLHFHPLLANSGIPGEIGDYTFDVVSSPIDTSSSTDPLPLAADASPLGVWIDISGGLDFTPLVQITNGNGLSFPVATVRQALNGTELQIIPGSPLPAGNYTAVIRDALGNVRMSADFSVSSVESETGSSGNDTAATSIDLGNIEDLGLVQIAGFIGNDPHYNFSRSNPGLFAGNDVDLYHFHIDSAIAVGLQVEVFAGRIGSALNAGVTLYRLDVSSGTLVYVAGDNESYNLTRATDGTVPLFHDPVIVAGLRAGEYFLAVSQGLNTVSLMENQDPANVTGIYDVAQAHSGAMGVNVGNYVLNVTVSPLGGAPEVTDVSINNLDVLTKAPAGFTVQFDQYMNLTGPAFVAFHQTSQSSVPGIFITDAQGNKYFPRLQDFDATTFQARFSMVDRLPHGPYQLHLSGSQGVTNLAGSPLVGNSPSGDFVVRFVVLPNPVGTNGNPHLWTHDRLTDLIPAAQDLGMLFPQELKSGVAFVRESSNGLGLGFDTADEYRFELLQTRTYRFHLSGTSLPAGVALTVVDHAGNPVALFSPDNGLTLIAQLPAGEYTLRVGSWPTSAARRLSYRIDFNLMGNPDNAPPLSSGPAALVSMRLVGDSIPNNGGVTPPVNSGGGTSTGGSSNGGSTTGGGSSGTLSSISSTIGPNDYSLGSSSSLTNLTLGTSGIAFGIPTLTSTSGNGPGSLRVTRTLGRGAGLKDGISLSGLSALADGPVGRSGSRFAGSAQAGLNRNTLRDIVKASLTTRPDGVSEKREVASDTPAPNQPQENLDATDATVDPQAVSAEETSKEMDSKQSRVVPQGKVDADQILEAVSQSLTPRRRAVALSSIDGPVDSTEMKSQRSTDKVFAAGLGLLLSELFLPRDGNSPVVRRVGEVSGRTGVRRPVHMKSKLQEDSVS